MPVGSALLATVLAVIALCGTAVFGASLSHLTATPTLYGDPFQLNISDPNGGGTPDPVLLKSLEHDRAVTGITQGIALPAVSIDKVVVGAIAGTADPRSASAVDGGRALHPTRTGEVGLGATTMRQVGAQSRFHRPASRCRLASGGSRTVPFRVVAQMSLPVLGNAVSLGTGAVFTLAGYEDAACPPVPSEPPVDSRWRSRPTAGCWPVSCRVQRVRQPSTATSTATGRSPPLPSHRPRSINFGEAVNFPLIFGAILALFGAATLLHLLVVSVTRRRREIGLLKVLGFVNGQVVSTVAWQAMTLAVAGIVIGVPLGIVVGRAVWHAFANNLGAVPVSVVPIWLVGVLVAGVLVVANLIAVAPAVVATRSKPRDLLRVA